jgi:hypothetical protein
MEQDFLTRLQNLEKKNQSAKIDLAKFEQKQTQLNDERIKIKEEMSAQNVDESTLASTVETLEKEIEVTLKENEGILN